MFWGGGRGGRRWGGRGCLFAPRVLLLFFFLWGVGVAFLSLSLKGLTYIQQGARGLESLKSPTSPCLEGDLEICCRVSILAAPEGHPLS